MNDKQILRRLLEYAKGHYRYFIYCTLMMIVSVGLQLLIPFIFKTVLELLGEDTIDFQEVLYMIVALFLSLVVSTVVEYYQAIILQKTGQKIIYNVREDVFTSIQKFSISQVNEIPVGKLVTRVTSDTNTLNEMYTSVIINLLKNVLTIIGVIIFMFLVNVELTLYTLIFAPIVLGISIIFRKTSRKAYRTVRQNVSNMNAFLSENFSGMKIIQVFNQEEKKLNEFKVNNSNLRKSSIKEILVFSIFRPSIYVLYILSVIVVLWIGGNNAILGVAGFTYAVIFAFYQYIEMLFNPIQQLAEQFNILQSAFASSERIFEVLDKKSEIVEKEDAIELDSIKGEIEFKNVWFSYIKDEWILKDVSFKVNAGDTVAFVGATGSGKTTILSLIVRNYDIQKGQILIDGIDIKDIKISSLRRNIGQMLQDVFLFSGTISSNISLNEENIPLEDIKEAAHYVNADKFIEKLPEKYDYEVRERGNNFSAGQRQLLSFARTVVHKPKIMILDEATANIDTETESLIQDSLEKMMNIGTMLIVAHRLSTIQHANKIIVLQKGEIIEEGNHQDLLKNKGHYYKLYQLQYKEKH